MSKSTKKWKKEKNGEKNNWWSIFWDFTTEMKLSVKINIKKTNLYKNYQNGDKKQKTKIKN